MNGGESGLSLVELLIALVLLGFGMLAVAPLFTSALTGTAAGADFGADRGERPVDGVTRHGGAFTGVERVSRLVPERAAQVDGAEMGPGAGESGIERDRAFQQHLDFFRDRQLSFSVW